MFKSFNCYLCRSPFFSAFFPHIHYWGTHLHSQTLTHPRFLPTIKCEGKGLQIRLKITFVF